MNIPTTLAELFETDPADIDLDDDSPDLEFDDPGFNDPRPNIYDINTELKLPPWLPSVVEVWSCEKPDHESRAGWNRVKTLLDQLYAEHKRRKH